MILSMILSSWFELWGSAAAGKTPEPKLGDVSKFDGSSRPTTTSNFLLLIDNSTLVLTTVLIEIR